MIKTEKNIELERLKETVRQKQELLDKETEELENLKSELREKDMENNSECPILLFMVNQSTPQWDDTHKQETAYIYYFPDYDATKCITRDRENEFLPNTIDMRGYFKNFGMPAQTYYGDTYHDYFGIVQKAASILQHFAKAFFEIKKPTPGNVEASDEKEDYRSLPTPQMRLYGLLDNPEKEIFDTKEEITDYIKAHNPLGLSIYTIDFLGNALGKQDVIRTTSESGRENIYTAYKNGIAIFNSKFARWEATTGHWEATTRDLKALHKAFRDRGIEFENDVYAEPEKEYPEGKRYYVKPIKK